MGALAKRAIAKQLTPTEWRMTEVVLRYLRQTTPKLLMMVCDTRRAAYIPMVLAAVGVYPPLIVAKVDTKFAHPNVMPVVTAT